MKIIERRENPFPEDLEGRLNAVLNVVNTEFKSVALLHSDDIPREASEIRARIRQTVGGGIYLPSSTTFQGYYHDTLVQIGAVAEEIIRRESVNEVYPVFCLSGAGKEYAVVPAIFALEYAVKMQESVHEALGITASNGKTRAPLNRVKILEALFQEEDGMTEAELSRTIGLGRAEIYVTLRKLEKIGFINFDSVGEAKRGEGVITYIWDGGKSQEQIKSYKREKTRTKEIVGLLKKRKRLTPTEVADELNIGLCSSSSILSHLVREGFALREGGYIGGLNQSKAELAKRALPFLSVVRKIKEVVSDKISLEDREQIYRDFVEGSRFRDLIREAIEIYRRISPYVNRKPREETNKRIINFLKANNGVRGCELLKRLGLYGGFGSKCLQSLVKTGILRKEKKGKETRYYAVN